MSFDTIAVVLVVAFAALFVGRRAVNTMRASKKVKGEGCDGCG